MSELPDDPVTRAQLAMVRTLRALGIRRRAIAAELGITPRRVTSLGEVYGLERPPTLYLTPGVCRATRELRGLGRSREAIAVELQLSPEQVDAILGRAPGTHGSGAWGDERHRVVGRRSRARGAGPDDLAPTKPGAVGRAPTRFGPIRRKDSLSS